MVEEMRQAYGRCESFLSTSTVAALSQDARTRLEQQEKELAELKETLARVQRQAALQETREAEEDALARRLAQAMLRDPRLKEVLKEFTT